MRSFSLRFAPEGVVLALALSAAVCGCTPDDGTKSREEGLAAFEADDIGRAEKLLTQSLRVAPNNADAWLTMAQVKVRVGDLIAAKEAVMKAVELAGDDIDVRLMDAQVAWYVKDYALATEKYLAIAKDESLTPELRSQGWAGVGIVEFTCNEPHRARLAFLKAIKLDRRNASAWYHLALVYRDGFGYSEAALDQFEVYVHLDAVASPRVQKVLKSMIPELKESIQRAAVNRAGSVTPNCTVSMAAINKAESELKKGGTKNLKNALKFYEDALKADPLSYQAALGLATTWQKVDKTKNGLSKSLDAYRTACVLKASAVGTYLTTGKLAYELGRYADATEIFSRAMAANPNSAEAIDWLIRSMTKTGNRKTAAEYQSYRDMITKKK